MNREVSKMLREINKYQINDEKLKCIIDRIENGDGESDLNKFYKYNNNKLYRKWKGRWRLYLLKGISDKVIAEIHQMYEHLGSKKCTKMIQEHFTMDQLAKKVNAYIRTCDVSTI